MALAKIPLSGSTHGRGIKIAATVVGSATTLHTAQATTTDGLGDEVVLYARNSDSVSRTLSIAFGGTTAPDDVQTFTIAAGATVQVCAGLLIRNALVVGGFADAANVVVVWGYVIRST
jgi:hypothetical protein